MSHYPGYDDGRIRDRTTPALDAEGIMVRVTLTQPGHPGWVMRHEGWEQTVSADVSIAQTVRRFWEDPAGTAVVPAVR